MPAKMPKATRIKDKLFGFYIEALPEVNRYGVLCYSSDLQGQVREQTATMSTIVDFLKDHRSAPQMSFRVVLDHADACSACGCRWETYQEDGKGFCAGCGAEVQIANG